MDYFEKINMNIITDLVSNEVKSSLVKEKFFKNNVYNDVYAEKVANEVIDSMIKDNYSYLRKFINSYNTTVKQVFDTLQFVEGIQDSWISNICEKDRSIEISFNFNEDIKLIIKNSNVSYSFSVSLFSSESGDYSPDMSIYRNGVLVFEIREMNLNYGRNLEYKYNPTIAKLESYKIGELEYPVEKYGSYNKYERAESVFEKIKDNSSLIELQRILHNLIIEPLEYAIERKNIGIDLINKNPLGGLIKYKFEAYRKEVLRLTQNSPITQLIPVDQLSEEFVEDFKYLTEQLREGKEIKPKQEIKEKKKNDSTKKIFGFLRK